MKNKELKTLWKLARQFWIVSFVLWIIETTIFIIIEGWHLKATHPAEIYIDSIVSKMWVFAFTLTCLIGMYYIINLNKLTNK